MTTVNKSLQNIIKSLQKFFIIDDIDKDWKALSKTAMINLRKIIN